MTGNQYYAHRYRETAVRTANPLQLVVMLYDAAICSLKEARGHMEQKNIAERSKSINKCIAIITELQACLDRNAGGEIASSLDRLYDYMKRCLVRAGFEQSVQPLNETEALLENLASAWRQLVSQNPNPAITTMQQYPLASAPVAGAPVAAAAAAESMSNKPFSISA